MLKTLNRKFTDLATAVAFAECGEWQSARECIGDFDSAARSEKRKFIIMIEGDAVERPFLDYIGNLSIRLCYDVVFLHLSQRPKAGKRVKSSIETAKDRLLDHCRTFVSALQDAGIGIHYFVSAGSAEETLEKVYHRVGNVEFAIVPQGVAIDECDHLGLPLFIFQSRTGRPNHHLTEDRHEQSK